MIRYALALFIAILFSPAIQAANIIELLPYASAEFAPARGEAFKIPFMLHRAAQVSVDVYTSDGDLIRTLKTNAALKPGQHALSWDGKDRDGAVVPDEAYIPVLRAQLPDGTRVTHDPRGVSGGEMIDDLGVRITPDRNISYRLPVPARVLIRVGIKGGPMLRSLASWEPRNAGRIVQRWDGFDSDNLTDLRISPKLSVLVTAFELPRGAIITSGNQGIRYVAYRQQKGWETPKIDAAKFTLERNGRRVSRTYNFPRVLQTDPLVNISFVGNHKTSSAPSAVPRVTGLLTVRVDIPQSDRRLVQESLYEVAFFIDNEFVAEEEHGFVPLTWQWRPTGLAPGEHILTVNVSGFEGNVGVKSVLFEIPE